MQSSLLPNSPRPRRARRHFIRPVQSIDKDHGVSETARKRAEALKEVGNAAARRGDWATAEQRYSEALQLTPHDHLIRSNRSLVYTKLGRGEDAMGDARARRAAPRSLSDAPSAEEGRAAGADVVSPGAALLPSQEVVSLLSTWPKGWLRFAMALEAAGEAPPCCV